MWLDYSKYKTNGTSGSEDNEDAAGSVDEDMLEDDDDEEAAPVRPYVALLQGFTDDNAPNAKRRKLDHSSSKAANIDMEAPEDGNDDESEDEGKTQDADAVDEPEDAGPEMDEQPLEDDSSDGEEEATDPFDIHFARPDEEKSAMSVKAAKSGEWTTKRALFKPWRATFQQPGTDANMEIPSHTTSLEPYGLKKKLKETAAKHLTNLSEVEQGIAPMLFGYRDILHCDRTVKDSQALRRMVCLHALNHVFKDKVIKNNYKLAKESDNAELDLRDQGFTRPKVLFLLPTRNSCARMINVLRDLCEPDQQENRKRFDESYIDKQNTFGQDRPIDFRDLFEGNDDDMFRLGVKFTRKTMKYFAQFYNSDILFASPLGLRMAIGSEEEKKKVDYDFLSSIEMVVMDQSDALLMQNWEHIEFIFEHLNLQPKDAHDCDFSRVRSWYLEDWAKYFRQTVILSAFNTPELTELFRTRCQNWQGKARLQLEYAGNLQQLGVKAKQTFSRFQAPSPDKDPDARFKYFTSAIVPGLVKRAKDATGTLIYIPSYLDFVRVRNYFANAQEVLSLSFGAISEYSDVPEASRARSHFLNGRHRVLLYTERAHHFRRYQLRGVHRVIFYGLPDNPIFYKEIAGGYLGKSEEDMRIEPGQGSVRVMFSKYDVMKLERTVGSKRVGKMIQDRGDTFDFV
ncbi:U3 small nucleolar RNA-associated protein 25 [Emericellopsis cladophorae]|uniref:U3 small nucleolar RNA-associated protein 25 n=1 Tax=Emericellopsis cladophorae TaxID=2686198 RepID=A0A9Q0BH70_9HYPO|nr:U3 small nucleolar RNA-associated protein 25 [Emericellopsis cladophorae]KAI6784430.1 U3 small nucleolar RNA-associated protein 25 [Emericellopsis cladophorae]